MIRAVVSRRPVSRRWIVALSTDRRLHIVSDHRTRRVAREHARRINRALKGPQRRFL